MQLAIVNFKDYINFVRNMLPKQKIDLQQSGVYDNSLKRVRKKLERLTFFVGGRNSNLIPCIFYALSLSTELNSLGLTKLI